MIPVKLGIIGIVNRSQYDIDHEKSIEVRQALSSAFVSACLWRLVTNAVLALVAAVGIFTLPCPGCVGGRETVLSEALPLHGSSLRLCLPCQDAAPPPTSSHPRVSAQAQAAHQEHAGGRACSHLGYDLALDSSAVPIQPSAQVQTQDRLEQLGQPLSDPAIKSGALLNAINRFADAVKASIRGQPSLGNE